MFYSIMPLLVIAILNILIIKNIQAQKAFQMKPYVQQSMQQSSANNTSLLVMMVFPRSNCKDSKVFILLEATMQVT